MDTVDLLFEFMRIIFQNFKAFQIFCCPASKRYTTLSSIEMIASFSQRDTQFLFPNIKTTDSIYALLQFFF